ncbi:MAG: ATP-grasp domain-containing protein [Granulosicoccus sp.]
MNVLFTCVGSRNYLIEYFRTALGSSGAIFAADTSRLAPGLAAADKQFIVPPVAAANYVDKLLTLVEKESINAIISLNDLELPVLAAAAERFAEKNTRVLVSNSEVIDTCFDKWKSADFFKKIGINTPQTFINLDAALAAIDAGTLKMPLVIKPRWGSLSVAIDYVDRKSDLRLTFAMAKKKYRDSKIFVDSLAEESILIQEKIDGDEFGMDIINDLEGNYQATVTRIKHAMRAGETDIATIVTRPDLQNVGAKVGKELKHIGIMDADFFVNEEGIYGLELNPRFGGGYPFSHMAGVNVPKAIIKWLNGEKADPEWLRPSGEKTFAKISNMVEVSSGKTDDYITSYT